MYLVTFMLLTHNCVNNVLQETIIFYLKRYVIDYFLRNDGKTGEILRQHFGIFIVNMLAC